MLNTYIKIFFRNFRQNSLYTLVNIVGLTVGITSCLLIGVYILHELSYDRFHEKSSRIARVTMEYKVADVISEAGVTGTKVGPQLARMFPAVETYTRTILFPRVVGNDAKLFDEKKFLYADSAFFLMFDFKLVSGDVRTVLDAPNKIVLTRSAARKHFNTESVIGKSLKVGESQTFLVTGVAEDCPDNSQIKFDMVGSFSSLNAFKNEQWWSANYVTYILLKEANKLPLLQREVSKYMETVTKEIEMGSGNYFKLNLQPLEEVHLHSTLEGLEPNGSMVYIYILGAVGLLILVIACVNYTNLANAQSVKRASEIGVRKVLGAHQGELFRQFMIESFVLTSLSLCLAVLLATLLLPQFNNLSGKSLTALVFVQPSIIVFVATLLVSVTLLSGLYPALLLSSLQLSKILKAGFSFTGGGVGLRKSLIVFQFAISIFLLVCTFIILQQLSYIKQKDLGYNKEHVVVLPVDNKMLEGLDGIKEILKTAPGVQHVAGAYEEPTDVDWMDGITKGEGGTDVVSIAAIPVDEDFIETIGVKLVSGSDFSNADVKSFDTSDGGNNLRYSFLINESAAKKLGWTPDEAIGKVISKGSPGIIKGVIKDFHFKSMHTPIGPLLVFLDKRMVQRLFVKVDGENIQTTIAVIGKLWQEKVPHRPFEYHFLDEDFDALYNTEQKAAGVFSMFSTLAILLACLGLFALTAYSIVQRTKEIGIRKVLGASIPNIFILLSKDFLILIIIALLISCPVAWLAGRRWLDQFSYRVDIEWWMFAAAGASTLLIALLTLSYQTLKAAKSNPVESLRAE